MLWTPVTFAGISIPLPFDSCHSVSLVSQHHAPHVAQACPNLKFQNLNASLSGVATMEVPITWTFGNESIFVMIVVPGLASPICLVTTI